MRRVLDGTSIAHLATVLPDSSPHSTPVWVAAHGDRIVFLTGPSMRVHWGRLLLFGGGRLLVSPEFPAWQPGHRVVPSSQWKAVRAMRSHDEADYEEFVNARARALRRTAYLLCGDWHRAEDLVQSVFTSLYVNWHHVRDQASLDGYVRTMLVRRVIDESRRPWRRETASERLPDTAVRQSLAFEDRELVRTALRSLPARQRAVVVLRFFDDLDVEQTAALLDCSEGTVKSYTARALATLRTELGQHWPVPADRDGGIR